jgi:flagellar biosynthesis/type III secretory pathway ATPase
MLTGDQSDLTISVFLDGHVVDGVGESLDGSKNSFRHDEMKRKMKRRFG